MHTIYYVQRTHSDLTTLSIEKTVYGERIYKQHIHKVQTTVSSSTKQIVLAAYTWPCIF